MDTDYLSAPAGCPGSEEPQAQSLLWSIRSTEALGASQPAGKAMRWLKQQGGQRAHPSLNPGGQDTEDPALKAEGIMTETRVRAAVVRAGLAF